jgi:hypothetical protein
MQYQSPQGGGGVPGLGKYVHLSSSMPARRVRSPYLKWTIEEVSLPFNLAFLYKPSFIVRHRIPQGMDGIEERN